MLVEGCEACRNYRVYEKTDYVYAVEQVDETDTESEDKELDVLERSTMHQFEQYVKLNKKVPPEILSSLARIDEPSRLADTIAAHMAIRIEEKQQVLELFNVSERLEH